MIRLLLFWLIGGYSMLVAQATVYPEDQPVTLVGMLTVVHAYGPPGYGLMEATKSRDLKITYWALESPVEVTVPCTPDRPELAERQCGPTKNLRLFFPVGTGKTALESKARSMINRKVTIKGILHRRTQMIEMTPVYMNVVEISPKG